MTIEETKKIKELLNKIEVFEKLANEFSEGTDGWDALEYCYNDLSDQLISAIAECSHITPRCAEKIRLCCVKLHTAYCTTYDNTFSLTSAI